MQPEPNPPQHPPHPTEKRCQKCGNYHLQECSANVTQFRWPYPAREVFLIGEWTEWQSKEPMHRENNIFTAKLNLRTGTYKYKFVVDGKWAYDAAQPHQPNEYGDYNNIMEVYPMKMELPSVDLNEYTPSNQKAVKLTTHLIGNDVKVLGSWDGWSRPLPMIRKHNALRNCQESFIELILENDKPYEFKFQVNGDYVIDETRPTIRNQYGTLNNRMIIRQSNQIESPGPLSNARKSQGGKEIQPKLWEWKKVFVEDFREEIFGHSICNVGEWLFIFGGKRRSAFSSDLIRIKTSDLTKVDFERIPITPRAFHSAVPYGNKLIIFGGCSQADILSDYHVFVTNTNTWIESALIKGTPAHKREKGSCVRFEELLVFFGGYYLSSDIELETYFNDIELLDIENMTWVQPSRMEGSQPSPRFSHTACVYGDYMVVFGGQESQSKQLVTRYRNLNDVWQLNLKRTGNTLKWEQLKPIGKPPLPRHGHSANIIQHFMVIFGGMSSSSESCQSLNDVMILDLRRFEWYTEAITKGYIQ